jgi:uncharacterized protein
MYIGQPRRLVVALMTIVIAGCAAVQVALAPKPIALATGTPGSIAYAVGNAMCLMFNLAAEQQPKPCEAVSSDGSLVNIQQVESGKSVFGLSETDLAYAAYHGEGPFAGAGADPKLRMLIALYPETFTVLVHSNSKIRDFKDLRGEHIGIGTIGAGFTFTRDVVLGFYDWKISDTARLLELGPADQSRALCNNEVDAIIFEAGNPNGLTQDATTSCRARLVPVDGSPIDKLLAAHPYYVASVIPGRMYPGNPKDVPTFGTLAVLITSSDQPDDLAYAVVKAVFENFADFRRLHPALSALNVKDLVPPRSRDTDPSGSAQILSRGRAGQIDRSLGYKDVWKLRAPLRDAPPPFFRLKRREAPEELFRRP